MTSTRSLWLIYLPIIGLYLLLSIALFERYPVSVWPDSSGYQTVADQPLLSRGFWAGQRPLTIPLVYRLAGNGEAAITVNQVVFSTLAWLLLAAAVTRIFRTPAIRGLAFTVILALSLTPDVFVWHRVILSESVSNSLLAALTAVWILAVLRLRKHGRLSEQMAWAGGLLLCTFLWMFSRDSNPYLLLILAPWVVLMSFIWRRRLPFAVVTAAGMLALFVFHSYSADSAERWKKPLINVVAVRILTDEERTTFFTERGMPLNEDIQRLAGRPWASADMGVFGEWVEGDAPRDIYIEFLLSDFPRFALEPFEAWREVFWPDLWFFAQSDIPQWRWQPLLDNLLFKPEGVWLLLVGGLSLVGLMTARPNWRYIVPLTLLLLVPGAAFMGYHSDAMEVPRHSIGASLSARLGLWLVLLLGVEYIARTRWIKPLAGVVIAVVVLEIGLNAPAFRQQIAHPALTAFSPAANALAAWEVTDSQYRIYQVLEASTPVLSAEDEHLYIVTWETQVFQPRESYSGWRLTALPGGLDLPYLYVDGAAWARLDGYQRRLLDNPTHYRPLHRWRDGSRLWEVVGTLNGWQPAPLPPTDTPIGAAVIFSPVTGALQTDDFSRFIADFMAQTEPPPSERARLDALIAVFAATRFQDGLTLTAAQSEALARWRETKRPEDLRAAGLEYLLVPSGWWVYLSDHEAAVLSNPAYYTLVDEWEAEIPGFYRLYHANEAP